MNITYTLIGITVVISLLAFRNEGWMRQMMMNPYQIATSKQYYRFLTSGFIHKDLTHLFLNMFSFYFFGRAVEQVFSYVFGAAGGPYFIGLYLLAIIVSDLPTYFKQNKNPAYNSLGASGGVAALIAGFILFEPLQSICVYFALCMPGFILGALYIGYSYYMGRKSSDGINHDAHLFGALFGFAFCMIMYPRVIPHFIDQLKSWSIL